MVEFEPKAHHLVVEMGAWFQELDVEVIRRFPCG
jgi:hypothetical protein